MNWQSSPMRSPNERNAVAVSCFLPSAYTTSEIISIQGLSKLFSELGEKSRLSRVNVALGGGLPSFELLGKGSGGIPISIALRFFGALVAKVAKFPLLRDCRRLISMNESPLAHFQKSPILDFWSTVNTIHFSSSSNLVCFLGKLPIVNFYPQVGVCSPPTQPTYNHAHARISPHAYMCIHASPCYVCRSDVPGRTSRHSQVSI